MLRTIVDYHKELISSDTRTSSARFMALGAFYVSSWIMVWLAATNPTTLAQVFGFYIGTFTAAYLGGKLVASLNKDVKQ